MADRYWARLEFPASRIDVEIKEALETEGVEFDQNGLIEPAEDYIWIEDGIFSLEDCEARYGCFEDLEDLLRVKGIPFDRESSGFYEIIPEKVIFRPGENGEPGREMVFLLSQGEPIIEVRVAKEKLAQGADILAAYLDDVFPAYPSLQELVQEEKP